MVKTSLKSPRVMWPTSLIALIQITSFLKTAFLTPRIVCFSLRLTAAAAVCRSLKWNSSEPRHLVMLPSLVTKSLRPPVTAPALRV